MITFPRFLLRSRRYVDTCRDIIRNPSSQNQHYSLQRRISPTNFIVVRSYCEAIDPVDAVKAAASKVRAKTPEAPKITLLNTNNSVHSVTTVVEAERIAAGCNLKLVRIVDPEIRTSRPVFRLMTDAQFLEEEIRERGKQTERKPQSQAPANKLTKLMMLSCQISDNDFETKMKKAMKWLEKSCEVRVVISGTSNNMTPQVFIM